MVPFNKRIYTSSYISTYVYEYIRIYLYEYISVFIGTYLYIYKYVYISTPICNEMITLFRDAVNMIL